MGVLSSYSWSNLSLKVALFSLIVFCQTFLGTGKARHVTEWKMIGVAVYMFAILGLWGIYLFLYTTSCICNNIESYYPHVLKCIACLCNIYSLLQWFPNWRLLCSWKSLPILDSAYCPTVHLLLLTQGYASHSRLLSFTPAYLLTVCLGRYEYPEHPFVE